MLQLLIKKQFFESFKSYFVNLKTGKLKTKAGVIRTFALFFFVLALLAFSFFGMSMLMIDAYSFIPWLSYAVFGLMSIFVGTVIVMFLASNILYKSKDNEQLLAMPIDSRNILTSRMIVLYTLATVYSAVIYFPVCINSWIHGINSPLAIILSLLSILLIGLLVTSLSAACGYVVFSLSNKFKNKAFGTVILSISIIVLYYIVYFRLNEIFSNIIIYGEQIAKGFKTYGYFIYCLANGSSGDLISFIIFTVFSLAVFALVYFVISKNFIKTITSEAGNVTKAKKVTYQNQNSVFVSLLKKELSRFTNCSVYMMNTGLGILIVVFVAVFSVIKKDDIASLTNLLYTEFSEYAGFLPLLVIGCILFVISLDLISTPSISLEGKNIYILKTLPIEPVAILKAKEMFHVYMNSIPTLLSAVVVSFMFNIDNNSLPYILLIIFFYIEVQSLIGLVIGVSRVDLNWTNEVEPVKQSLNVLFAMLICWALVILIIVPYYFLRNLMNVNDYMFAVIMVLIVTTLLLRRWISTKGVEKFNSI